MEDKLEESEDKEMILGDDILNPFTGTWVPWLDDPFRLQRSRRLCVKTAHHSLNQGAPSS
jgi:hypothetical protein